MLSYPFLGRTYSSFSGRRTTSLRAVSSGEARARRAIVSTRETPTYQDDVLRLFLEEGPDLVANLQDGADFMDLEELKRSAARLRALATVAGASWLAELCRDIDLRARFNELAEIPGLVRRAAIEHAHVRFGIRGGSDGGDAMITPALNGSLA